MKARADDMRFPAFVAVPMGADAAAGAPMPAAEGDTRLPDLLAQPAAISATSVSNAPACIMNFFIRSSTVWFV